MALDFMKKTIKNPSNIQEPSAEDNKKPEKKQKKPAQKPEKGAQFPQQRVQKQAPILLGVDIGNEQVKIAVGQYVRGRVSVKGLYSAKLPERAVSDGNIERHLEVGLTIDNLLREHGVRNKKAVCAVESSEILRREVSVPRVGAKDLSSMIKYELDEHLPIDLNSYALQYRILEEQTDAKMMQVNVSAMPKKMAAKYQLTMKNGGLNPWALDTHTNGLEKLIFLEDKRTKGFKAQNMVFIDMGRLQFNISFYSGGHCFFNKKLEMGGKMLDNVFLNNLEIGAKKVEQLKIQNLTKLGVTEIAKYYLQLTRTGREPKDQEDIILVELMQTINSWVDEIGSVLKYFVMREDGTQIDKIYLYGGCAKIKELDTYFTSRLRIETVVLNKLNCLDLGKRYEPDVIHTYLNAICALIRL